MKDQDLYNIWFPVLASMLLVLFISGVIYSDCAIEESELVPMQDLVERAITEGKHGTPAYRREKTDLAERWIREEFVFELSDRIEGEEATWDACPSGLCLGSGFLIERRWVGGLLFETGFGDYVTLEMVVDLDGLRRKEEVSL